MFLIDEIDCFGELLNKNDIVFELFIDDIELDMKEQEESGDGLAVEHLQPIDLTNWLFILGIVLLK